ncbi:MAG: VCBS repeat-containing protein [Acidobacteriota bacterium]
MTLRVWIAGLLLAALFTGCADSDSETPTAEMPTEAPAATGPAAGVDSLPEGLLVGLAVLGKDDDGKPLPLPARLGLLTVDEGHWQWRQIEDADSNVFHKAMPYTTPDGETGVLTFGGTAAIVRWWRPGHDPVEVWREDFGGRHSRMRDAEIGDLDGDGVDEIAVATHDQGVVVILDPIAAEDGSFGFAVEELDRKADTFVHEIEIGDLDGDGTPEVYATPSARNQLDGSEQPGEITRYAGGERSVVGALGDRHAKEILVADVDGDGRDELYAAIEAVSGGEVEIRRYDADGDSFTETLVATLPDTLTRFLTVGDLDGDGTRELVAAASKSGLWLLRDGEKVLIDRDSGGFEHAALLTDLDGDGADELYVASDRHGEIRRYIWRDGSPVRTVIHRHEGGLSGFTWNLMPVPADLARALAP